MLDFIAAWLPIAVLFIGIFGNFWCLGKALAIVRRYQAELEQTKALNAVLMNLAYEGWKLRGAGAPKDVRIALVANENDEDAEWLNEMATRPRARRWAPWRKDHE